MLEARLGKCSLRRVYWVHKFDLGTVYAFWRWRRVDYRVPAFGLLSSAGMQCSVGGLAKLPGLAARYAVIL